jgi:hypothetical protein
MLDAQAILRALGEIIANPTSNLTVAVFLLSATAIAILMVVLLITLRLLPAPRRRGSGARRKPRVTAHALDTGSSGDDVVDGTVAAERPVRRFSFSMASRAGSLVIAGIVTLAVLASYVVTSQSWYCITCHAKAPESPGLRAVDSAHEHVACVACHEDAGAVVANSINRLADLGAQAGLWRSQYGDAVRTSRCLRCHGSQVAVRSVDASTGVAMSHEEPLDAGWSCVRCHGDVGHGSTRALNKMSNCLTCHDARTASADCAACHTKDPTLASSLRGQRVYGKADIRPRDCEGCHSSQTCDACHGLRMPHSDEFLDQHPRYAGFHKKQLCFAQCHEQVDCGRCHAGWDSHGPDFFSQHKRLPRDAVCSSCHSRHSGTMCSLCHDF